MAEPFKNAFNPSLVEDIARHLLAQGPFDADRFIALATTGLEALELKARSHHIADALEATLPEDFPTACAQMLAALHPDVQDDGWVGRDTDAGLRGWAMLPLGEYVSRRGLNDFDLSLETLRQFTPRMSAEFDVRLFLIADLDRALTHVRRWVTDPNPHIRRLASEGTRPRLPWGMQLKALIADPTPILPILTALRDDDSEYVRRSVANSLNDIAKDHPDLVADIAADWLKRAPAPRRKLIRHACRSLIKAGHPGVLKSFGYGPVQLSNAEVSVIPEIAEMGDDLAITLTLEASAAKPQPVLIDYVLHHRRANGGSGPKVFKWTEGTLMPGAEAVFTKTHKLRAVTTRRHYPGRHRIEAQVNGKVVAEAAFDLAT